MIVNSNLDKLKWKSEYNIGNLKIDDEHKALFSLVKKALTLDFSNNNNSKEKDEIKFIITELFTYVETHFKNEERYMKSIDFPDFEEHKNIHKNMTLMLTSLINEIDILETEEIRTRLFKLIEEYFINHITQEDKKFESWNMSLANSKDSKE